MLGDLRSELVDRQLPSRQDYAGRRTDNLDRIGEGHPEPIDRLLDAQDEVPLRLFRRRQDPRSEDICLGGRDVVRRTPHAPGQQHALVFDGSSDQIRRDALDPCVERQQCRARRGVLDATPASDGQQVALSERVAQMVSGQPERNHVLSFDLLDHGRQSPSPWCAARSTPRSAASA